MSRHLARTFDFPADGRPFTHDELAAACHRVAENHGCAGADGLTVDQFTRGGNVLLARLGHAIEEGRYRAFPLLPIEIAKDREGLTTRRLLIPTVRDRVAQTAAARRLLPDLEDQLLDSSFGYRPHRGVDTAIARVVALRDAGFMWLVEADIDGFFDHIDHDVLRAAVRTTVDDALVRVLISLWLHQRVWTGSALLPLQRGVPQGSPLSPLLANLFLARFDEDLIRQEFKVIRYADDFVILVRSAEAGAAALDAVARELDALGLSLNREKTGVRSFEEGFVFLGVHFRAREAWVPWKAKHRGMHVVRVSPPIPADLRRALLDEIHPEHARHVHTSRRPHARPSQRPPAASTTPVEAEGEMRMLYVVEQGAVVRKSGNRVLVEKDGTLLLDEPMSRFDAVMVFGQVQVTAHALAAMADAGLRVCLLTRQSAVRALVVPETQNRVQLRVKQFAQLADQSRALDLARATVAGKIRSASAVLERYRRNGGPVDAQILERLDESVKQTAAVSGLESLNGVEGTAARLYFDAVMRQNKSTFTWTGRHRRPSTDPINALLSLFYTMLGNEVRGLVSACGLEPCLGFLHTPVANRPSLALDLMEPFRHPIVDRFVLTLINRGTAGEGDFQAGREEEGLYLKPDAFKRVIGAWEDWVDAEPKEERSGGPPVNYRALIRREVVRFAAAIDRGEPFTPAEVLV